jgi:hypothetical protein
MDSLVNSTKQQNKIKQELTDVFLQIIYKIEKDRILSNSFCETIIQLSKPNK